VGTIFTFAIGYLVGLHTDKKDYDDLAQAVKALRQSEEFAGVVMAARSHLGHSMRALADAVDGGSVLAAGQSGLDDDADLVARVKDLFAHDSGR
jgi:hypothetical protein